MKDPEIELPSNKKFGLTFASIFLIFAGYFYVSEIAILAVLLTLVSLIFLFLSFALPSLLEPVNKLWMRFGLLLGAIVSPVVLGLMFFCLFSPIAFVMRLVGRDELRIRLKEKRSYWVTRTDFTNSGSFEKQF